MWKSIWERKTGLFSFSYNPKRVADNRTLQETGKNRDKLSSKYDIMLLGEFNADPIETAI